ncbi:MAG: acyltransferase [Lachnospiraceae bacterium]|nr:acyltransferase [Lachnospiraceae bacterium]
MNKYVRAAYSLPFGMLKMTWIKLFHLTKFKGPIVSWISPLTEITIDGGKLEIGKNFKMRDGAKIRVRKGAICQIGNNSFVNSNGMIVCHEKIIVGENVEFGPNVQLYDHDHDFRVEGGLKAGKFKTSPIVIGDNVWIGANTVILRGTTIGNHAVIGAGSVVKGNVPEGAVLVQKRENFIL